jgi:hypothetical protein
MDIKKQKILVGVIIGVGAYFLYNKIVKNFIKKTPIAQPTTEANFSNANGNGGSGYVAKKYDASHVNEDGSNGATWIAYNDSDVVGFWKKGKVAIGSKVNA